MDTNPNILIVGAGAGGLVLGYHLHLSGAEVTFYVREKRAEDLGRPQMLYSYDQQEMNTYGDFNVITDFADVDASSVDFILVTLDGSAVRSSDGEQLLRRIGDAFRYSSAEILCFSVSVGIKDYYVETTGMNPERIKSGYFTFLSHPGVVPGQVVLSEAEKSELEKCDFAYRHFMGTGGVTLVGDKSDQALAQFADLYSSNPHSKCGVTDAVTAQMADLIFPIFVANRIGDWPGPDAVVQDKSLWSMACGASREIARLPVFGWKGSFAAVFLRGFVWRFAWLWMHKKCWPLDFDAFNRFHHGAKVIAQDIDILRDYLALGKKSGMEMPALTRLVGEVERA